ncbi:cytochrome c nitrite reductase pentaheme subunit [Lonepinella koalarum]|nr:cytochrome c nitrite reductase pentaheme subunit [Lonepinella koalarum]MDH2927765.1 cytochrome c nitrite reductase pentaheme subunit [Lonepinella koalarum]TFJ90625.1 cytochrome c nitrite reductase pentaheme subunit [Lonepinella koalarum]
MKMNSIIKFAKISTLLMLSVGAISIAQAETLTTPTEVNSASYEPSLENDRNPNEYCAKCHSFDTTSAQAKGEFHAGKFHGIHLDQKNPTTGKPITCVTCHGNISENHRRGVKDVMRFHGLWDNDQVIKYTPAEQNEVCFSCHQPEKLQEKFWAHDVHSIKLACASCHTLHPKQDAMKDIQPKARVKLCVDCHSKQQKLKQQDQHSTEKDKK